MPKLKYFAWIDDPDAAPQAPLHGPLPTFDFESLGSKSAFSRGFQRFLLRRVLPFVAFILRWLCPNPRFGRIVIVTRAADARAVLGDMTRFPVVYTPEMRLLGGGHDNVLAGDGDKHDRLRAELLAALPHTDLDKVGKWSRLAAEQLVAAGGGRLDVMRDLITRTATEVSGRYLGLTVNDPDAFAEWTMAVSGMLFGDYFGDANVRRQALTGSAHLLGLIDDAIARVHQNPNPARDRVSVIDKLIASGTMSDGEVRAAAIGLVTAFVPTNTLAGGNMLEELLSRPEQWGAAVRAAKSGDKGGLQQILIEAGRRNTALSPGLWRHVPLGAQAITIAPDSWRKRTVQPGDAVLICVPSALRDKRRDESDKEDMSEEERVRRHAWMMFGHGPHNCLGAGLALAHLTEVFAVLLKLDDLAPVRGRDGRMLRTGPYPTRLDMSWTAPEAQRAHVLAALPVVDGTPLADVLEEAGKIGNPIEGELRTRLNASKVILFTSLTVVEAARSSTNAIVIVEINADGTRETAIGAYCDAMFDELKGLLARCTANGVPIADKAAMADLLDRAAFDLDHKPWGNTGLHFDGLPDLSVADIERQDRLAAYARRTIDYHTKRDFSLSSRAMDALTRVRRMIGQDAFYRLRGAHDPVWSDLLKDGAEFEYAILRPSRKRLAIADWAPPKSIWTPLVPMLLSPDGRPILLLLLAAWVAAGISLGWWLAPSGGGGWFDWSWTVALGIIGGAVIAAIAAISLVLLFLVILRRHERQDHSDSDIADIDHVRAVSAKEDATGYAQNHIVALMPFKPGRFRKLSFAFTMWGIKQAVSFWFRPGFVVTMGTIHKARWFRLPGTQQFVFFSNYDGSWESYLEDFITRAHEGQTAAWSHGMGFPPTRLLILDGAANGDRFKRWVRRQQRVTPIWYSRFPELTAKQIRTNAMIEDGLARAASATDARRWLAHFGSSQRELAELESQESQTILFSGFGHQVEATALAVTLPTSRSACKSWLEAVTGLRYRPSLPAPLSPGFASVTLARESTAALAPEETLRFGDIPVEGGGCALGFTESGLRRAGLDEASGIEQFPAAFRMTMADRCGLLGDARRGDEAEEASTWRFSDREDSANGVDALLMIYGAPGSVTHQAQVARHSALLTGFGGTIVHKVPCSPVKPGAKPGDDVEHFGWRDGISQPVIQGIRRTRGRVPARDEVPAGEFLLGYPNGQGFVAPPITTGAHLDPANILPTVAASTSNRFPFFGNRSGDPDLRDFGRNGSFLAVRLLDQDVDGFHDQLERAAANLRRDYRHLGTVQGTKIDGNWLGAKIIGRWKDGSPLIGNPTGPSGNAEPDNNFAYGVDDPRGIACPLGSHIRRTNPRDSQEPGDADEQQITNRHRLLRRGRSYRYDADGSGREVRGLLFMALCADLERQFEFVQHTWVNASSFHGLSHEADPLLGNLLARSGQFVPASDSSAAVSEKTKHPAIFSIPTELGAVRVEGLQSYVAMRGGGYFFVPSRSAMMFLIQRLSRPASH
mgnify:CR=1 FL=1